MSWTDTVNNDLRFVIPESLLIHLETWVASAGGREVSGVGIMEADAAAKTFTLKKVWLMAAGSGSYTEIPGAKMVELLKEGVRPDQIKVWWHRHPVGNGVTGPHNWSGTDNNTIREEPFGINPTMVKWLLAIVRTPLGWVARYDNHETQTTIHMPVECGISLEEYKSVRSLVEHHLQVETALAMQQGGNGNGQRTTVPLKKKYNFPSKDKAAGAHPVFKQLGMEPLSELHTNEKSRLHEVKWEEDTYRRVLEAIEYDLPEFVAFENGVSIYDMHKVGILEDDDISIIERRIQNGIETDDSQYIQLISNWDFNG